MHFGISISDFGSTRHRKTVNYEKPKWGLCRINRLIHCKTIFCDSDNRYRPRQYAPCAGCPHGYAVQPHGTLHELPVEGTCGGMALCASCHVYVQSDHALPEPSDDELAMLDQAFFVKNNSRLGCQIRIKDEMEGLVVQLAPVGG